MLSLELSGCYVSIMQIAVGMIMTYANGKAAGFSELLEPNFKKATNEKTRQTDKNLQAQTTVWWLPEGGLVGGR